MHIPSNPGDGIDSDPARGVLTGPPPDPASTTIPRRPGSARRTSHIEMSFRETGDGPPSLVMTGAARDLATGSDGSASEHASAGIEALVDHDHIVRRLDLQPHRPSAAALVGRMAGSGFRQAAREALPDEAAARTPLALLLDDLPVAELIAGYMNMYDGDSPRRRPSEVTRVDICAGWRSDGTMMTQAAVLGRLPVPFGPTAPDLDHGVADPVAWHAIAPLPRSTMRRRRLLDVWPDGGAGDLAVHAMFRDTHCQPDGTETVLHEYSLEARVRDGVITHCVATPRVLPWVECPAAAASAGRLVGMNVNEVRTVVRAEFVGTSTCTHLNDLLRSLGDVDVLCQLTSERSADHRRGGYNHR